MTTPDTNSNIHARVAVYYHPEAYTISTSGRIMGRQSAGEGFLNALFKASGQNAVYCYSETEAEFRHFTGQFRQFAPDKSAGWIPCSKPAAIEQAGNLYVAGPDIGIHAQRRWVSDPCSYSITGITHTVCSEVAMRAITDLCTAPVEPWDALICTSTAVKNVVEKLLTVRESFISERYQPQKKWMRPALPVIPLGVDCDRFAPSATSPAVRQQVRRQHGIAENQIVVLYFGRLSFHAKAHPLPMFVALEQAAVKTGKQPVLILAGWTANEAILKAFVETARQLCPSIKVLIMDARNPAISSTVWYAADIFCSFPDNIQESFGLTPIEAQAAGLPVVVSDWNGYRDTVEDGVTGFRIPTVAPGPGNAEELVWRYLSGQDNYDHYIGNVSQSVSVDIDAAARAFTNLMEKDELRTSMGMAARKRARALYDWPVVISGYFDLWHELATIRNRRIDPMPTSPGYSLPDPFTLYSDYPTHLLLPDTVLYPAGGNPIARLTEFTRLEINLLGRKVMADESVYRNMIQKVIEQGQSSVRQLLVGIPEENQGQLIRTLGWLIKIGVLRINPD